MNAQVILIKSEMALAAYAELDGNALSAQKSSLKNAEFSDVQADIFATKYAVVDQYKDMVTSFSATVFKDAGGHASALRHPPERHLDAGRSRPLGGRWFITGHRPEDQRSTCRAHRLHDRPGTGQYRKCTVSLGISAKPYLPIDSGSSCASGRRRNPNLSHQIICRESIETERR